MKREPGRQSHIINTWYYTHLNSLSFPLMSDTRIIIPDDSFPLLVCDDTSFVASRYRDTLAELITQWKTNSSPFGCWKERRRRRRRTKDLGARKREGDCGWSLLRIVGLENRYRSPQIAQGATPPLQQHASRSTQTHQLFFPTWLLFH